MTDKLDMKSFLRGAVCLPASQDVHRDKQDNGNRWNECPDRDCPLGELSEGGSVILDKSPSEPEKP